VHKEATAVAVVNASKKSPDGIDCRNQGSSIVQFVKRLRGELHVTPEEGTGAAWL
jgi:hypothetical protein